MEQADVVRYFDTTYGPGSYLRAGTELIQRGLVRPVARKVPSITSKGRRVAEDIIGFAMHTGHLDQFADPADLPVFIAGIQASLVSPEWKEELGDDPGPEEQAVWMLLALVERVAKFADLAAAEEFHRRVGG